MEGRKANPASLATGQLNTMAAEPGSDKSPRVLGGVASILSLLGITLFFSGWIDRWAYFASYSLNLNDQSFTVQSYGIVPIQIDLGTPLNLLKTVLLLWLLPLLITTTLAVLSRLAALLAALPNRLPWLRQLLELQGAPATRLAESRRFLAPAVRSSILSDPATLQLWRLLNQEPTGWLYMIRTLPSDAKADERPLLIAVRIQRRSDCRRSTEPTMKGHARVHPDWPYTTLLLSL